MPSKTDLGTRKKIAELRRNGASKSEAIEETGCSRPTINKYWEDTKAEIALLKSKEEYRTAALLQLEEGTARIEIVKETPLDLEEVKQLQEELREETQNEIESLVEKRERMRNENKKLEKHNEKLREYKSDLENNIENKRDELQKIAHDIKRAEKERDQLIEQTRKERDERMEDEKRFSLVRRLQALSDLEANEAWSLVRPLPLNEEDLDLYAGTMHQSSPVYSSN